MRNSVVAKQNNVELGSDLLLYIEEFVFDLRLSPWENSPFSSIDLNEFIEFKNSSMIAKVGQDDGISGTLLGYIIGLAIALGITLTRAELILGYMENIILPSWVFVSKSYKDWSLMLDWLRMRTICHQIGL